LGGAAAPYWLALRTRVERAWLLWGLAFCAWACVHSSGVHATVTGIVLGLLTPVRAPPDEQEPPSARFEH
jgi:NhaA family Na+:H+ antiporter